MTPIPAPGETQLSTLLASMHPVLSIDEHVFCVVSGSESSHASVTQSLLKEYPDIFPIGQFQEEEGTTLILKRADADQMGLAYEFVARKITLTVHSSLSAVGFMAAIATHLSQQGISVNPVSGYYHDHLFVPSDRADEAMQHLLSLSRQQASQLSTLPQNPV
ncbi:MAG: ACT domain-containing protein [Elainellaceae cyanobacterium]